MKNTNVDNEFKNYEGVFTSHKYGEYNDKYAPVICYWMRTEQDRNLGCSHVVRRLYERFNNIALSNTRDALSYIVNEIEKNEDLINDIYNTNKSCVINIEGFASVAIESKFLSNSTDYTEVKIASVAPVVWDGTHLRGLNMTNGEKYIEVLKNGNVQKYYFNRYGEFRPVDVWDD